MLHKRIKEKNTYYWKYIEVKNILGTKIKYDIYEVYSKKDLVYLGSVHRLDVADEIVNSHNNLVLDEKLKITKLV